MTFSVLIFLFFSFLGILLSVLFLLKSKGDRMANILLSVYVLLFSFELLNNCLRWSGELYTSKFIHLNLTHFPLWVIYGPLVYIYCRRVLSTSMFKTADLLFLIPPISIVALLAPFYLLGSAKKLEVVKEGQTWDYALFPSFAIWLVIALMFFYAFLTYLSFARHSTIGFRQHRWLKWFLGSYVGFVCAFTLYIVLVRFGLMDPSYDYFIDLGIVFFIGMLAFFGFVQPEIFEGKTIKEIIPFIKYKKTGLSPALSLEMKQKLLDIMQREKPHLNNELRLDDMSRLMNLSRNHTSQIINEHFNLSFFDFINRYRIKEAKKLLMHNDENRLTMTQIAYDVGFNNRASFYKAFKKFTDFNPSDYIKHTAAS